MKTYTFSANLLDGTWKAFDVIAGDIDGAWFGAVNYCVSSGYLTGCKTIELLQII